jgi:hypothetical protein
MLGFSQAPTMKIKIVCEGGLKVMLKQLGISLRLDIDGG